MFKWLRERLKRINPCEECEHFNWNGHRCIKNDFYIASCRKSTCRDWQIKQEELRKEKCGFKEWY